MKKLTTLIIMVVILFGCQEKTEKITDSKDYNKYLNTANTPSKDAVQKDLEFWQNRFNDDTTRF